jgi:hypothetical protein
MKQKLHIDIEINEMRRNDRCLVLFCWYHKRRLHLQKIVSVCK